jgi:Probable Zinc-ribbon domain
MVVPGSNKKVWWLCSEDPNHEWEASPAERARAGRGCPVCNRGWTVAAIRNFVSSLKEHLFAFTAAELYLLFQQNGLLRAKGEGESFVKALATGRFPIEEIEKFRSRSRGSRGSWWTGAEESAMVEEEGAGDERT